MEIPPFVHESVPNRSLGPRERRWCLAAIAATCLAIGGAMAALGAWPVLPFAGLEAALVALAFHVLSRHDGDFERLEIVGGQLRYESRDAKRDTRMVAHGAWARVVFEERGSRCSLALRYGGRSVPLGRLLSDEGRRRLAGAVRAQLAASRN